MITNIYICSLLFFLYFYSHVYNFYYRGIRLEVCNNNKTVYNIHNNLKTKQNDILKTKIKLLEIENNINLLEIVKRNTLSLF